MEKEKTIIKTIIKLKDDDVVKMPNGKYYMVFECGITKQLPDGWNGECVKRDHVIRYYEGGYDYAKNHK